MDCDLPQHRGEPMPAVAETISTCPDCHETHHYAVCRDCADMLDSATALACLSCGRQGDVDHFDLAHFDLLVVRRR